MCKIFTGGIFVSLIEIAMVDGMIAVILGGFCARRIASGPISSAGNQLR